ncbi:MAG: iron-containing alcohol dehydrogenase family protein [Solobacterium sp.]|jgi:glycerol dehydrogenase|nr:iron-containing alcohol dehydrogenase family protein [Solobacterium sp.]
MYSIYLPRYTIGIDAYQSFQTILRSAGKSCAVYYGKHAWQAAGRKILSSLSDSGIEIAAQGVYGHEASIENAEFILHDPKVKNASFLLAVGGGKCTDTVKYAGWKLHKPVYSCPTIASNCAPVTKIAIMYHPDGSFREIAQLAEPPVHCFIDTEILSQAPLQYVWAGMGDTMAKHVESIFSARGDILSYPSRLGIKIGELCFYDILDCGRQAYCDAEKHKVSAAFEEAVQNIIISTGAVSVSVSKDYNSALAHALYYGLTIRKEVDEHHLHGEIVSYGTLVQLMMDDQKEMLQKAYAFNKDLGLPTKLSQLDLNIHEDLHDVLQAAQNNQELAHVPYPVTSEKIYEAMQKLEEYAGGDQ